MEEANRRRISSEPERDKWKERGITREGDNRRERGIIGGG